MNGRGDDTMTMLKGYAHTIDFFTSFEWWLTEPHDELVNNGNYCLAEPGSIYVVYLPHGGRAMIHLQDGSYSGTLFKPVSRREDPATARPRPRMDIPGDPRQQRLGSPSAKEIRGFGEWALHFRLNRMTGKPWKGVGK